MNSADICRKNGWGPGTEIVGDEGYGPSVILITAIGEEHILARMIFHDGKPVKNEENMWTLEHRDWKLHRPAILHPPAG